MRDWEGKKQAMGGSGDQNINSMVKKEQAFLQPSEEDQVISTMTVVWSTPAWFQVMTQSCRS